MYINSIFEGTPFIKLNDSDNNGREINIFKIENVSPYGDTFYPNTLFRSHFSIINPIREKVMSLGDLKQNNIEEKIYETKNIIEEPLFFFIYNTDNYYHFVYDSLPYLISYLKLKEIVPKLKLLMNYPNFSKKQFYKFVIEFLEILDITEKDIVIIDKDVSYNEVYVSNSYTHDINSNLPPRKEIYDFYKKIVEISKKRYNSDISKLPKKIYVSRRTWIHGDNSNIGTNYTNRRRLECEDDLVKILESKDIKEIFTENLSTVEKIIIFNNAELVIGAIGGGLCNVLFGNSSLNLLCIVSPTFLDVNYRFKYCFENVKCVYFEETFHVEKDIFKKWMRIKTDNIIGEIEEVEGEYLTISYTDNFIAGWNSEIEYIKIKIKKDNCQLLDNGLNSLWNFNLQNFCNKFLSN